MKNAYRLCCSGFFKFVLLNRKQADLYLLL